jgi:hypothetical protein
VRGVAYSGEEENFFRNREEKNRMTKENKRNEAETICLLTMLTMNLLLLVVIGGMVWTIRTIITDANILRVFHDGSFFP